MQSLDVISVNIWQIVISLANLALLFLLLKKFLYQPVKRMLAKREEELAAVYGQAEQARADADRAKATWEQTVSGADSEADRIIKTATEQAKVRSDRMMEEAREQAAGIVQRAEAEGELAKERARAEIRQEIIEVSGALTEKMLGREIRPEDHEDLIDQFIDGVGESDGRDQ